MEKQNIAVVTGSSTGIGFETSLLLARNGFYTYATMRDTHKSDNIEKIANNENLPLKVLSMDVDNDDSVRNAIQKILEEKEKINILINNAGYGLFGALEDMFLDEIKRQFDTNLFGAIRTIKEVLPSMRKQKNGIIINVTSIAGVVGIPAECAYVSSKFALEGLSESISYELQPFGIKVILVDLVLSILILYQILNFQIRMKILIHIKLHRIKKRRNPKIIIILIKILSK